MRLKTFTGKSVGDVIEKVRKELGPNAFIVSTHEDTKGVKITAAVDEPISLTEKTVSGIESLLHLFDVHKVPSFMTESLLEKLYPTSSHQTITWILSHLFKLNPLKQQPHKPMILVGQPGSGKSLAIGKLAAQGRMDGCDVGIINLDTQKSGAIQQMKAYTDAINTPYFVANQPDEVVHLLNNDLKDKHVFIDTPGFNPFYEADVRIIAELVLAVKVPPILVLPAATDMYEALDIVRAVQKMGVYQFIHTKIDLSYRLTALMGVLASTDLELVSLGCGPTLADSLKPATSSLLHDILTHQHQQNTFDFIHMPPMTTGAF